MTLYFYLKCSWAHAKRSAVTLETWSKQLEYCRSRPDDLTMKDCLMMYLLLCNLVSSTISGWSLDMPHLVSVFCSCKLWADCIVLQLSDIICGNVWWESTEERKGHWEVAFFQNLVCPRLEYMFKAICKKILRHSFLSGALGNHLKSINDTHIIWLCRTFRRCLRLCYATVCSNCSPAWIWTIISILICTLFLALIVWNSISKPDCNQIFARKMQY